MNPDYLKSKFSKFQSLPFRPGQSRAIDWIINSPRKYNILCSPQGSGKSLIGMCAGAHYGKFLYLCSSKFLQAQIETFFPEAYLMKGRNNFTCNLIPKYTAAECIYSTHKKDCKEKLYCNYEVRKAEVLQAQYQILNYHYFLFESNYIGKFSDYDLILCDEADTLEGILSSFISLKLSKRFIYDLHIKTPGRRTTKARDSISSWTDWINDTLGKIIVQQKSLKTQSESTPDIDPEKLKLIKQINYLQNITTKLKLFKSNLDKTWLFDDSRGFEFKPTWLLPEFTQSYFFRHGAKFVFMSATFPPKQIFAKQLAIPSDEINTLELTESAFPSKNRPVILSPSANMTYATYTEELPKLLVAIKLILSTHKSDKGLIHTVSWKLNEAVMSIGSVRFITHDSHNKEERLEFFKADTTPSVFVSPSSMRGLDLPDDLCRFTIITKFPYQSLKDKLVNSRVYSGPLGQSWFISDASQELIQACGRHIRHDRDYGITYILDTQAVDKILKHQEYFPQYFFKSLDLDD